jgi:GT2 family glycosyltransferase
MAGRRIPATPSSVAFDNANPQDKLRLPTDSSSPGFSIVIPTRNRPRELAACLETIVALDYPRSKFEVFIVDDGGDLDSSALDHVRDSITIRLLKQPHRGPASARNRGVAAASGQYVAFTDDDCAVDRGWLRALAAAFSANPAAIVGGTTISGERASLFAVASQNVIDFLYDHHAAMPDPSRYFTANNLACARDILRNIGGFDESFRRAAAEDRDLCERWSEAGLPLVLEPSAVVTHGSVHRSIARYLAQHFRYGQGAIALRGARQRRGSAPYRAPAGFFTRLVVFPLRQGISARNVTLSLLAGVSQVSYGVGYVSERLADALRRPEQARILADEHPGEGGARYSVTL